MPAAGANRWRKQPAQMRRRTDRVSHLVSFATRNFSRGGSLHRGISTAMPARVYASRRDVYVAEQMIADELLDAQI
jgi:hypothetical protein